MSTFFTNKKRCAVCGTENEIKVWGSTHASGFCDLDFRPPEEERSLLYVEVEKCQKCGFVGLDIESKENAEVYKKIADRDSYAKCDGINFANQTAENYYKTFLINKGLRKSKISSFIMLRNAAWACDDSKDDKNGIICRTKALDFLEDLILSKHKKEEILILIKIDFLRRCEKYDEVMHSYNDYQFIDADNMQVYKFQKFLAKKKDSKVHTFDEVISYIEP